MAVTPKIGILVRSSQTLLGSWLPNFTPESRNRKPSAERSLQGDSNVATAYDRLYDSVKSRGSQPESGCEGQGSRAWVFNSLVLF